MKSIYHPLLPFAFFLSPFLFAFLPSCPPALGQTPQTNIVLRGDFPDPTIIRDGDTFYMTNSSYEYYPGLLIWKSKDLLHWERLTHALNNYVGEVWAPDMVKYNDLYYIYFPTNRGGNFVITAKNPAGPWSEPMHIDIKGIDPGHIATPDGKRYLYLNSGRMAPLAADGLSVTDVMKQVYEGWIYPLEYGVECFCLESPKLVYREPYYYMTSAQGGTSGPATSHMAVSARSKSPVGPWENSPYNPVVRTWKASEPWVSKGHATVFSGAQDQWYMVYHGYENGHWHMGRSTMIEPVEWTSDGWYKSQVKDLNYQIINNNEIISDDFSKPDLNLQWSFSGITLKDDYWIKKGQLTFNTLEDKLHVVHCITGTPNYEASVKLSTTENAEAGLVVYFTDAYFAGLGIKNGVLFDLFNGRKHWGPEIKNPDIKYLNLRLDHYTLYLSYSTDGKTWQPYDIALDVTGYQRNILGVYSLKLGVYGKGEGTVTVDDFTFKPLL